ncbi:MAG: tRNA (cytidine(34)-2'-O)-methyltransferase [Clostridiales bacterium]|jgi:tRNA (cytidine/uridine-2'-O-)-methyltransferase|nr:tRNA (cytidine(34)-2'-O)-methyltransferase [Clostridiales bacterium]
MLNIVLVEPVIPMNTGNIARTCAATGTALHLVGPLGFSISDKALKRAGLDYWHLVSVTYYEDFSKFLKKNPNISGYYASTKASRSYCDVKYSDGDYIFFGKETAGLDEELLASNYSRTVRIPIREDARSLNLSNSVAVVLFEALRQLGFPGLKAEGHLTDGSTGSAAPDWSE